MSLFKRKIIKRNGNDLITSQPKYKFPGLKTEINGFYCQMARSFRGGLCFELEATDRKSITNYQNERSSTSKKQDV